MKCLILASQSPRRKELLEAAGFTFQVHPSHVDESINPQLSFSENAMAIAHKKALHITSQVSGIILAADSFVVCENEILGKPKDSKDAIRMLQKLGLNLLGAVLVQKRQMTLGLVVRVAGVAAVFMAGG